MVSAQITAKSIRDNIASTTTCTPATVSTLSDLLLPKSNSPSQNETLTVKKNGNSRTTATAKSKPLPTKSRGKKAADQENEQLCEDQLSAREKSILATETINAALKSLTEAIKASSQVSARKQADSKEPNRPQARKVLRRSTSVPQSPLQPRSLNRVASSPNISNRQNRSPSCASAHEPTYRPTAECARIAFACLRTLQAAKAVDPTAFPPLQIENGMSVLIGKLLLLGLEDLAIKEVRMLKRRLDPEDMPKKGTKLTISSSTTPTLSELLNFKRVEISGAKLNLAIATQLQVLRILASTKNVDQIEASLPFLFPQHPSSPSSFILAARKEIADPKQLDKLDRQLQSLSEILFSLTPGVSSNDDTPGQLDKLDRQLQSLSEILFSLTPGVSSNDDAAASDPRISTPPSISLQIHSIGLQTRLLSWQVSGRCGNVSKDFYDPLLRCLSAFTRRSTYTPTETYQLAFQVFNHLQTLMPDSQIRMIETRVSSLSNIFRLLGSLAKDAGLFSEAIEWTTKYQATLEIEAVSEARKCAILARLVALKLKTMEFNAGDEESFMLLLDMLDKPFKGDATDVDDLMAEVAYVRRAANNILLKGRDSSKQTVLGPGLRDMCESLILLCPKLSLRFLGNPLSQDATPKDIIRYNQRRQLIASSALHSIDSVLFLVRNISGEGCLTWELIDARLQECLLLYGRLETGNGDISLSNEQYSAYYVRISNLYYSQYLNFHRATIVAKDTQQLRALRRAVECVQTRPLKERQSACLWAKLERLADFYKQAGRFDELLDTLVTLRDELIEQGHLATVVELASSKPLTMAWTHNNEISALRRSILSLIKVEIKCFKTTKLSQFTGLTWSKEQYAVVLEDQLQTMSSFSNNDLARGVLMHYCRQLIEIYSEKKYPVRRLRVLLHLFLLDFEESGDVVENLVFELKQCCQEANVIDGTKDSALKAYFENLRTTVEANLELRQENPDVGVIKQAISRWTVLRERCSTMSDLESQVDDVSSLLSHLQSISDWLNMQGHSSVRLATLRLIVEINELYDVSHNSSELVQCFTNLGTQWLHLGYSGKAGMSFEKAKDLSRGNGVSSYAMLQLYLSYAQYLLAIDNNEKCEEQLSIACSLFSNGSEATPGSQPFTTRADKTRQYVLNATAFLVNAMLAFGKGDMEAAVNDAKTAVRLLRHAWAFVETHLGHRSSSTNSNHSKTCGNSTESGDTELSQLSSTDTAANPDAATNYGSCFWPLINPLYNALCFVAQVYAHNGMFLETNHYLQESHKLAMAAGSEFYSSQSATLLGSSYLKAGMLDNGRKYLNLIRHTNNQKENHHSRAEAFLSFHTGVMHGILGDHDTELAAYDASEQMLIALTDPRKASALDKVSNTGATLESAMSKLSISTTRPIASRKAPARTNPTTAKQTTSRTKASATVKSPVAEHCPLLIADKEMVLRQKARTLISLKQSNAALKLLQAIDSSAGSQLRMIDHKFTLAKQIFQECVEKMAIDADYSALQESTLSFPAALKSEKAGERLSMLAASSPRRPAKTGRNQGRSKSPVTNGFFENLSRAQECLLEIHSIALSVSSTTAINEIATLLNSITILLSAFGHLRGKLQAFPNSGSCSVGKFTYEYFEASLTSEELARNLALRRSRRACLAESNAPVKLDSTCWPSMTKNESRKYSTGSSNDLSKFQQNYVDIIPKSWTAISIALSDSRDELSITKFQAGSTPFVLRLPLGRHNSMDADEDVFGFEQGRLELREIIELANESAHDARDMSTKEAKANWWQGREALDARLRDLLENIEKVWLGGFTGIFSQHARRTDLLARFQKSFHSILDKHLPSRRKGNKKGSCQRVALDSRILELFIGLGDASDEECDFSEPLTDLLNFVVDVLHYHGEQNEYAEIDFDSIVIETHDALRGYHAAVKATGTSDENRHTILILDKALHCFPWESLPCMEKCAVSRLPSLGALKDRIVKMQDEVPAMSREGQYIDRSSGGYILNPGGDLKSTQSVFGKELEGLEWDGIVQREPKEEEIKYTLSEKELFLYFGHGSGAQYIRAKEVRRLDRCAVSWLMGCSSGALTEAGEFEPYGPAMNYIQAGCPALVATLWDVTDKDIDRFAKSAFEHWGLFGKDLPTGKGKGKGKKKLEAVEEPSRTLSLVEAVAKGREVCNLKYLNAAAVVVYGVPVYFR